MYSQWTVDIDGKDRSMASGLGIVFYSFVGREN
jgi:hypothetical protein